jgi:hypothetical protein
MTTKVIEIERRDSADTMRGVVPELTELFIPCPICRGTTDVDYDGIAFCYSCGQRWTIFGKPVAAAALENGEEAAL